MKKLIEQINILGPWVHGYFDLGNGLVIEDQDKVQRKRLACCRDYYIDIIRKTDNIPRKTLCDIGCNTGFFLYELYKRFDFQEVTGLEPRTSNLDKAKFIKKYFGLSENYKLKKYDILTKPKESYDITLLSGVLHHIDNHLLALENLYDMTKELCIIETSVLPSEINSKVVSDSLALKDPVYERIKDVFGVSGYKVETDYLDGSAYRSGIVCIPTVESLIMMLKHVGFKNVTVYRGVEQLKKEIYTGNYHRKMHFVIVTAEKGSEKAENYDAILRDIQKEEFNTIVPMDIIGRLYRGMAVDFDTKEKYYSVIVKNFRHAPAHKIGFEYAKTCYHEGLAEEAEEVLENLKVTINLDWRTVYKTYYLLALINLNKGNERKALEYNRLSLHAFDSYFLARELSTNIN